MFQFDLVPLLLRETVGKRTLPREPEPMEMNGLEQVSVYADSGRIDDGIMAVSNIFHAAHATQVIQGCERVLDLGCGPATQLVRIAKLNPTTRFVGVDVAQEMVKNAKLFLEKENTDNVDILRDDITKLESIPDRSCDGVISTVTLHHLPTKEDLKRSFIQIKRVLRPGGAIYLSDFCRLKSLRSVLHFAYKYRKQLPHILCLDYERSLRAAFLLEEFNQLLSEIDFLDYSLYSTFLVPFMMVIKTEDKPVAADTREKILQMQQHLTRTYQKELDDLRRFFRINGMEDEIFS